MVVMVVRGVVGRKHCNIHSSTVCHSMVKTVVGAPLAEMEQMVAGEDEVARVDEPVVL